MSKPRPEWLTKLLKVPCTPAQARQIIKRNQWVIDTLPKMQPGKKIMNTIGCPQCLANAAKPCRHCAWAKYDPKEDDGMCIEADFNGITLNDVSSAWPLYLGFEPDSEELKQAGGFGYHRKELMACKRDIRTFAEGHIRWCKLVIRMGGVK